MPRPMQWRRLKKPKLVRLKMPGVGLPRDVLRVSLETRDRELGEARIAMFRDLYARLQFALLLARHEDRFTTEQLHQAYRAGEGALAALLAQHSGRLLAPLVAKWFRSYQKVNRKKVHMHVTRFLAGHGGAKATTACLTSEHIEAFLAGLTQEKRGPARRTARVARTASTPGPKPKARPAADEGPKLASGGTKNHYRGSLSGFCTWLVRHDYLSTHPIAHKRVAKAAQNDPRTPAPLTPDDYRGYLDAITADRPDLRLVFVLLLHTGADLGEVLSRTVAHVQLDRTTPRLRFKRTKTKTPERVVPIDAAVANELRAHLALHGLRGEDRLFGMVRRHHVEDVHATARLAIGRPSLTIKDLRHIAAIAWVRAGVRIDRVSQLLGHATINQTMIYIVHAPDTTEEADIARLGAAELRGPANVTPITAARAAREA